MDKLICIGKNYLEHAKELGDAVPESPVLFLKPPSTALFVKHEGEIQNVVLPKGRGSVHPECEIVLRLDSAKKFDAVTLGLDMTLRDVQKELKKGGHPWEVSKVFANAAVLGPWISLSAFPNYLHEEFSFTVDGVLFQKGCGKEMRFPPQDCLLHASNSFPLCEGDVLFTGTPEGVRGVLPGQMGELRWGSRILFQVKFS